MRRFATAPLPISIAAPPVPGAGLSTVRKLLPYVWQWRWRVMTALACLVAAKLANIGVPLVLRSLVDALDLKPGDPRTALVVPVALLLAYGALRVSVTLFTEMREFLWTHRANLFRFLRWAGRMRSARISTVSPSITHT